MENRFRSRDIRPGAGLAGSGLSKKRSLRRGANPRRICNDAEVGFPASGVSPLIQAKNRSDRRGRGFIPLRLRGTSCTPSRYRSNTARSIPGQAKQAAQLESAPADISVVLDDEVPAAVAAHMADVMPAIDREGRDGVEEVDRDAAGIGHDPFVKDGANHLWKVRVNLRGDEERKEML